MDPVVALFMLIGLLMASPWVPPGTRVLRSEPLLVDMLAGAMLGVGLWHALWHGLLQLGDRQGQLSLVSGAVMAAVALLLGVAHGSAPWHRSPWLMRVHAALQPVAGPLVVALALCFAVATVELVRQRLH